MCAFRYTTFSATVKGVSVRPDVQTARAEFAPGQIGFFSPESRPTLSVTSYVMPFRFKAATRPTDRLRRGDATATPGKFQSNPKAL